MKLVRWVSPVRIVEAETGWPRRVCRRVVLGRDRDWLAAVLRGWIVLGAAASGMIALAAFEQEFDADAWWRIEIAWRLFPFVLASGVLLAALALGVHIARIMRVRRMILRYLYRPWCPRCRYPLLEVARGQRVCIECGEAIPAEIATLFERRTGV